MKTLPDHVCVVPRSVLKQLGATADGAIMLADMGANEVYKDAARKAAIKADEDDRRRWEANRT